MPHFILMKDKELPEADALKLRARLHIRAFWTLMRHGRHAQGIITLYDGFESAVRSYSIRHKLQVPTEFREWGTRVYKYLARSGFVTNDIHIESFENLMTRALEPDFDEMNPDFDFQKLWRDMEKVFRELEIVPFDFKSLPAENEVTRRAMGIE